MMMIASWESSWQAQIEAELLISICFVGDNRFVNV